MDLSSPALTIGLAMGAGVVAQVIGRHLSIPGIVLLLASGVLLGPDVLGVVRPETLGTALRILVGFAVAVILFDGGMNLDVGRIRQEAVAIRRLVTVGALITALGGTLAARYLLAWEWRLAILFGTLVIVTGPTVITPLVRRLRLRDPAGTILEAEGVLIDPVGAIIAVVALEVLYAGERTFLAGLGTAAGGLGLGTLMGLASGVLITLLLRPRRLIPPGFENILVLAMVVAVFQIAETLRPESGLTTVVVAGLVVGNVRTRVSRELLDFKEQLTVLMIGMLFVLLAADVRLGEVYALGWRGLATVAALVLLVRPLQVWLCTEGARLERRDRIFLAAMAPRGIVAAAVASLFAEHLRERGFPEGSDLRAMVFLVIGITVVVYGFTSGWIANALKLRRPARNGFVILGANALALALARVLEDDRNEVILIDSNIDRVSDAREAGHRVVHGQGLQPEVIEEVDPESRLGCIALTPNEEVNLLFAKRVREEARLPSLWVALRHEARGIPIATVHEAGAAVLFGRPRRLEGWIERFAEGMAVIELRTRSASTSVPGRLDQEQSLLILAVRRRGRVVPYDDHVTFGAREEIVVALDAVRRSEADTALEAHGFVQSAPVASASDGDG